jgi:hypothetical protein
MAVRTDIPLVALEAYAFAELKVAQTNPACGLRWTTLAGIGGWSPTTAGPTVPR